jgi:hypothetical protein
VVCIKSYCKKKIFIFVSLKHNYLKKMYVLLFNNDANIRANNAQVARLFISFHNMLLWKKIWAMFITTTFVVMKKKSKILPLGFHIQNKNQLNRRYLKFQFKQLWNCSEFNKSHSRLVDQHAALLLIKIDNEISFSCLNIL